MTNWGINTLKLLFILGAASLLNGRIALADRYPDDGNVSSLKGQLVEVGDKHRFHHNFPRTNVSFNPFGILYGSYSAAASFAVFENVALRANMVYLEPEINDVHGYELGLSAPIYFRKMYAGFYLEPGVTRIENKSSKAEDRSSKFAPQVLIGYSWFWDSGWNISMAAGMGRNLLYNKPGYNASDRTFGNSYLQVGYAF